MNWPHGFKEIIEGILGVELTAEKIGKDWEFETAEQAQLHLDKIKLMRKELRIAKLTANYQKQAIMDSYSSKIKSVKASFFSHLLLEPEKNRKLKQGELRKQRDAILRQYQNVNETIDKLLKGLDDSQILIDRLLRGGKSDDF